MASTKIASMQKVNFAVQLADPKELLKYYAQLADNYDEMAELKKYKGPVLCADEVSRLVPENYRAQARVLDIGAGTGKVGVELQKRGFVHLDALDACEEMLTVLKKTKVYQNTYTEYIGVGNTTIPQRSYDVVVVVGSLYEGHIPVEGLDEMIAATKPGGVVVNVMRQGSEVEKFMEKLKPHVDLLEKQGKWKKEAWITHPRIVGDKPGLTFSYRVL